VTDAGDLVPTPAGPAATWPMIVVTAALAVANLGALIAGFLVVSESAYNAAVASPAVSLGTTPADVWYPLTLIALGQGLLTGLVLLPWKRSRRVGLGVVLGTLVVAVAGVVTVLIGLRGIAS
jgi:hypothetical protein